MYLFVAERLFATRCDKIIPEFGAVSGYGSDMETHLDTAPHILVVDDHAEIRDLVAQYLIKNGLRATVAAGGVEMRAALKTASIDLVVLDIMMPGEDGLSLTRHIRETTDLPVILLTARAEDTDRIVGLEIGADDYLTKPFNPRELLARISAVLRRAKSLPKATINGLAASASPVLAFAGYRLDPASRTLLDSNQQGVEVSSAEFTLLYTFAERPSLVLTRDQLLDLTTGRTADVFDRSIDNMISRLRKKIEPDPKNPTIIKTVRSAGYVFAVPVETVKGDA